MANLKFNAMSFCLFLRSLADVAIERQDVLTTGGPGGYVSFCAEKLLGILRFSVRQIAKSNTAGICNRCSAMRCDNLMLLLLFCAKTSVVQPRRWTNQSVG